MKKLLYLVILFLITSIISTAFSQQNSTPYIKKQSKKTNLDITYSTSDWNGQIGGYMLPSIGTINTLIIFSQFPDDKYDTNNVMWPKGKDPLDKNDWINQTWTSNPIPGSLTHYFNDMSFNKFKFIGKTVSVISPHTRKWYLDNNWKRGDIQKEIILQINKTMNFAEFDNWKSGIYKQLNEPDGYIDLIIFIWRNIAKEFSNENTIKAILDFSNNSRDLGKLITTGNTEQYDFTVDNGLRDVLIMSSGLTVRNYLPDRNDAFRTTVHEIAHYLLGDVNYHNGFGFWGMLRSYGVKSIVANSFERSRLGWIKLKTIPGNFVQTISAVKLADYVTTGDSYCFVIDSVSGQYFYLENHQDISYWETTYKTGNIEKGLYVIRKDSLTPSNFFDNPSSANMRLIPADGRFDWTVNQVVNNPWGSVPSTLPVFKKLQPDRINGYHDLDFIPWIWNGIREKPIPIYFTEDQNGKAQMDVKYRGDGNDAFRIGYNEVFSPWSNPNSYKANRTPTPFGFKIDSLVNGVYSIDIYVNNSLVAPPSKPIGLIVSFDSLNNGVKLIWQANLEPDLSSYEISRKIAAEGNDWEVIGNTKNTSFKDDSIHYSAGNLIVNYRVRAEDTQSLYSVYSDLKSLMIEHNITDINKTDKNKEYRLYQNYPNPFNPNTTIQYSIPKESYVTLKIFNVLGEQITTLVNERKPAGEYLINFNATNLSSGIYFYRMQAGSFVSTKKFVLLK